MTTGTVESRTVCGGRGEQNFPYQPPTTDGLSMYLALYKFSKFWSGVRLSNIRGCWNFKGSKDVIGYGFSSVTIDRIKRAHRLAYLIYFGNFDRSLLVCHRCDNRQCCNPNHLFLGTIKDNNQDMWRKGRGVNGRVTKDYFSTLNIPAWKKYTLRRKSKKQCVVCGKPSVRANLCLEHHEKQRVKNRIYRLNHLHQDGLGT